MSITGFPITDSYHYYHKGVQSDPPWAYKDARLQIANRWAGFMKAMPDTANILVQDVSFENLGGSISPFGTINTITVSGAGSETKHKWNGRSWEVWFDLRYEMQLIFMPSGNPQPAQTGLSAVELEGTIAQQASPFVE